MSTPMENKLLVTAQVHGAADEEEPKEKKRSSETLTNIRDKGEKTAYKVDKLQTSILEIINDKRDEENICLSKSPNSKPGADAEESKRGQQVTKIVERNCLEDEEDGQIGNTVIYHKSPRTETEIISMEQITIPPRTEVLCKGKLKSLDASVLVCEAVDVGNRDVHVASVVAWNSTVIPVRLINLSNVKYQIQKGQKLGIAVQGEEDHEGGNGENVMGTLDATNKDWIPDGFDLSHLNGKGREMLTELLRKFADLFKAENDILTSTTKV